VLKLCDSVTATPFLEQFFFAVTGRQHHYEKYNIVLFIKMLSKKRIAAGKRDAEKKADAAGPHHQISCPNPPRCGNFRHVSLIVVIAATDFHRCHQP